MHSTNVGSADKAASGKANLAGLTVLLAMMGLVGLNLAAPAIGSMWQNHTASTGISPLVPVLTRSV